MCLSHCYHSKIQNVKLNSALAGCCPVPIRGEHEHGQHSGRGDDVQTDLRAAEARLHPGLVKVGHAAGDAIQIQRLSGKIAYEVKSLETVTCKFWPFNSLLQFKNISMRLLDS